MSLDTSLISAVPGLPRGHLRDQVYLHVLAIGFTVQL